MGTAWAHLSPDLSPEQLSYLTGIPVATLLVYASGETRPTAVVSALAAATAAGPSSAVLVEGLTSYPRLGHWLGRWLADGPQAAEADGLRLLKQTVTHAARLTRSQDVAVFHLAPVLTGSAGWDATLAAAASITARRLGVPAPEWTTEPRRTVEGLWSPIPSLPRWRGRAFVETPIEFRSRGVLLRRQDLVSV